MDDTVPCDRSATATSTACPTTRSRLQWAINPGPPSNDEATRQCSESGPILPNRRFLLWKVPRGSGGFRLAWAECVPEMCSPERLPRVCTPRGAQSAYPECMAVVHGMAACLKRVPRLAELSYTRVRTRRGKCYRSTFTRYPPKTHWSKTVAVDVACGPDAAQLGPTCLATVRHRVH